MVYDYDQELPLKVKCPVTREHAGFHNGCGLASGGGAGVGARFAVAKRRPDYRQLDRIGIGASCCLGRPRLVLARFALLAGDGPLGAGRGPMVASPPAAGLELRSLAHRPGQRDRGAGAICHRAFRSDVERGGQTLRHSICRGGFLFVLAVAVVYFKTSATATGARSIKRSRTGTSRSENENWRCPSCNECLPAAFPASRGQSRTTTTPRPPPAPSRPPRALFQNHSFMEPPRSWQNFPR
jgi:hypothetical protein